METFIIRTFIIICTLSTLVSCQMLTNNVTVTPTEISVPLPVETQDSISQGEDTPIPPTQTASVNPDFRFLNVPGSVFVGSYFSGDYIEIDFTQQAVLNHDFPPNCRILQSGLKALCRKQNSLSMYDVATKDDALLFQAEKMQGWRLTEAGKSLHYSSGGEGGIVFSLYVYEFQMGEVRFLGEFDLSTWLVTPSLSNDANYIVGARYDDDAKANWYIVDTATDATKRLPASDNFWATYNVAWSPIDDNILLGETNVTVEIGSCPNRIINYDVAANLVRAVVEAPYGNCYDDFGLHGGDNWSPDGSMVALMIQQSTLCLISMTDTTQTCVPLPGSFDKPIRNVTWSPDSRYLIYLTSEYELQIYSIADESIISIGYIPKSLSANILVWAANN